MREVIARIVDRSEFDEYKAEFGQDRCCVAMRGLAGGAVGIVANQKMHQNADSCGGAGRRGTKRTEFGGVIYTESAQKAARFIMDCNQSLIPLIFLHDVNGFMVGKDAEWSWDYSGGGEDGFGGEYERGAEDYGDCGRKLWRGALCDVREGV